MPMPTLYAQYDIGNIPFGRSHLRFLIECNIWRRRTRKAYNVGVFLKFPQKTPHAKKYVETL